MHRDIASMMPLQLLPCIVGLQPASHRVCSYFCNNCFIETGTRNRRSISSCMLQSIPCSFFMQRSLHGPTAMSSVSASKAGVVITSIVDAQLSALACSVAAELALLVHRRCRPGDPSAIVAPLVSSLTHCAVWSPLLCVPALQGGVGKCRSDNNDDGFILQGVWQDLQTSGIP